ncbi:RTX calcium-binding nonapeptide repeat (4 copies) [compost metagenome]
MENLTLTGAAAINGTGNALANQITGNAANNILNGAAGADRLAGGLGNDTYVVDNAGDVVVEAASAGTDSVQSAISHVLAANVENLTLTGAAAINGTGNTLANAITGNAANNLLNGGAGNDRLTGGVGEDTFLFSAAPNQASNVDTLTDFVSGVDQIALSRAIYSTISDASLASGAFFRLGTAALDADDRILYDRTSGALAYDSDGTGAAAAVRIAIVGVAAHPAISSADFSLA